MTAFGGSSIPTAMERTAAGGEVSAVGSWRVRVSVVILLAIALLIGSWPFLPALEWMWEWWIGSPEYSHGLLLPPLVAFLIWRRRTLLAENAFTGSWFGLILIGLAAAIYWVGELSALYFVVHFAYWIFLCGMALSLLGWPAFRLIAVPLAILLLAIPLPEFLIENLSSKLQLWSSVLGVAFIRLFGISVFLQGNVIDLGQYKLEVAEACSGVRYLFPLLTLGAVVAYLYRGALWKRVFVVLSTIPLTLITNSLRIGVIGVLVDRWGPGIAEGFVHDFQGWAMFMLTGAALVGELALLHPIGATTGSWRDALGDHRAAPLAHTPAAREERIPAAFIAAVMVAVTLGIAGERAPRHAELAPARQAFAEFPDQFGAWSGRRSSLDYQYVDALGLDDYLMADYSRPDSLPINLYVAFYNFQRKGSSVHSPRSCLPGGGWEIQEFGQRALAGVRIGTHPLVVNRAVVGLGGARALVYYWFQERGRVITNEFAVKWLLFWDAVTRRRTDGALVRLTTPVPAGSSIETADRRLAAFAAELAPVVPTYVPD